MAGIAGDGRREAAATRLRIFNYAAVYLRYRVPTSGQLQDPFQPPIYVHTRARGRADATNSPAPLRAAAPRQEFI